MDNMSAEVMLVRCHVVKDTLAQLFKISVLMMYLLFPTNRTSRRYFQRIMLSCSYFLFVCFFKWILFTLEYVATRDVFFRMCNIYLTDTRIANAWYTTVLRKQNKNLQSLEIFSK